MPTLSAVRPLAKSTRLEIRGATYEATPIQPGFAGVAAVHLVKIANGESYDVVIQADDLVVCTCPDFVCRHEGKGTRCKHARALVAAGLLAAPISVGSPVADVAPPAAVAPVTPADLKRARFFKLTIPAAPLAPAPIVEPPPVSFPEPRPTRAPRFVPTPDQDAERLGFDLGNSGEDAAAPAGWDFPRLVAFYDGLIAGRAALDAERAEYHVWVDGLSDRDPCDGWHHAEAIEAAGVFAARH